MPRLSRLLLVLAPLCMVWTLPAYAQTGVGLRVGTMGPGIEVARRVTPIVSVRARLSYLPRTHVPDYTLDRADVDVAFDGHVTLRSWSILVDVHPPVGPFRATAGVVSIGSLFQGRGRPLENYTFEGVTYTPDQMGAVTGEASWRSRIRPYLGIGTGRAPASRGVSFQFDLGVVFTGSPDFELTSTTLFLPTPDQVRRAEEVLDGIRVYPVLSLGVSVGI